VWRSLGGGPLRARALLAQPGSPGGGPVGGQSPPPGHLDRPSVLDRLRERFGPAVLETTDLRGEPTAVVAPAAIRAVLEFCKTEAGLDFDMLIDVTAVDYLKYPGREDGPRFEVVYHLFSLPHTRRLRLKVPVEETEAVVPTATGLWPIANWLEREVWDMFGIRFEGHPDLRRLLLYEEFEGHPLRKDYPVNRRQPLIGPRN
jgi:NADH-quinone oxidoreductase subunit C